MPSRARNGERDALHAKISQLQERVLATLDALDASETQKAEELREKDQQVNRLRKQNHALRAMIKGLEIEKKEMKDAVQALVDKIEKCNDFSQWPCGGMQISSFLDNLSRPSTHISEDADDMGDTRATPYSSHVIAHLQKALADERASQRAKFADAERVISTLKAQLGFREAELMRYASCTCRTRPDSLAIPQQEGQNPTTGVLDTETILRTLEFAKSRTRRYEQDIIEISKRLNALRPPGFFVDVAVNVPEVEPSSSNRPVPYPRLPSEISGPSHLARPQDAGHLVRGARVTVDEQRDQNDGDGDGDATIRPTLATPSLHPSSTLPLLPTLIQVPAAHKLHHLSVLEQFQQDVSALGGLLDELKVEREGWKKPDSIIKHGSHVSPILMEDHPIASSTPAKVIEVTSRSDQQGKGVGPLMEDNGSASALLDAAIHEVRSDGSDDEGPTEEDVISIVDRLFLASPEGRTNLQHVIPLLVDRTPPAAGSSTGNNTSLIVEAHVDVDASIGNHDEVDAITDLLDMDIDGPVSMVLATPLNPPSDLLGSPHQSHRLDVDGEGREVAPSINPPPGGAPPSLLLRSRSRSPNHSTESPYITSAHTPGDQPLSPPLVSPPSPSHSPVVFDGGDDVDSGHIAPEPPLHAEANPVVEDGAGIGDNSGWGNAFMSPLPLSPILGTPKTPDLSFGSSPESVDENGAEAQFTDPTPVASVDGVQTPILTGVGQGQLQETGTGTEPAVLDGHDDRGPSQLDAVEEHMRRVERELAAARGQLEVDEVERLRLQDEVDRLARQFSGLG